MTYVERHRGVRGEDGRAAVVRNGRGKARQVTLGSGTVAIEAPRVNEERVVDGEPQIYLKVAFDLARTLAHRERAARSRAYADFLALDAAIDDIAGQLSALESIETTATTVKKSGEKILKGSQTIREGLESQTECLREHVAAARCCLSRNPTA